MSDDNNDNGSPPPDLEEVLTENDWQRKTAWFPPEQKRQEPEPTPQAAYATRNRDKKKSEQQQTQLQVWAPTDKPTRAAISKAADAIANDQSKSDLIIGIIAHAEIHDFLRSLVDVLEHEETGSDLLAALRAILADERLPNLVLDLAGRKEDLDDEASDHLWELLEHLRRDLALSALCLALIHRPKLRAIVTALVDDAPMRGRMAATVAPGHARDFFVGVWDAGPQIQRNLATALARPDALNIAVRISERPDIAEAINTAIQNPQAADLGLRVLHRRGAAGWILRRLIGSSH